MRMKSFLSLIIFLMVSTLPLDAQSPEVNVPIADNQYITIEQDDLIIVEAEDFYKQSKSNKRQWYRTTLDYAPVVGQDDDKNHSQSASGNTYIELLPDSRVTHGDELIRGENFSNKAGEMAVVHYKVKINTPGRYYVWVRAFSTGSEDNGLHVGINGEWPAHGQRMQWCEGKNQWTWASRQRTKEDHCGIPHEIYLDITAKGIHDIQFSMREDGFEFDKFILTKNRNFFPTENLENELPSTWLGSEIGQPKINPPIGRIAIVADGNSPDPDDLGGTAVSIALLRATGLEKRLVHYSHSCDLKRVERISEAAEKERHALMQSACDVTARRWGGFEDLTFFDAKWQQKQTINDLSKAINTSSENDPLWIIEAGEPDIIGFALEASDNSKHKYVKVITHHPANDDSGDYYTWQQILDFGIEEVRIPDQNVNLKVPIEKWDWAKNHPDPRIQWVWIQGKIAEVDNIVKFQKGKWDCSDAGMVLYWITGAKDGGLKSGTVRDVKTILSKFIDKN
ncbi:hypothetical protein R3X28_09320 [Maribacter sp. TH_r10]|uniref:hypothetical protein n=1 Tax=Maribacter sp. TH_r10 TaxID=3082086 RepID=UPI0029541B85|nr:hypothetical protein [Maribacter sp. TH_r10]MDV7139075.1 hypothetical protein [Maribacter sp. TH_r10]